MNQNFGFVKKIYSSKALIYKCNQMDVINFHLGMISHCIFRLYFDSQTLKIELKEKSGFPFRFFTDLRDNQN